MKTFLEEVALDLELKLGDRLKDSALIFVNKRPLVYMQNFLSKITSQGSKVPVWSPALYTIQEFMNLSSNQPVADSFSQFFALWEAYRNTLDAKELDYARIDSFYRTGLTLISDFLQLDENLIPINQVFENLRNQTVLDLHFSELQPEQIDFLQSFWDSFSPERVHEKQEKFLYFWIRMPRLYTNFHKILQNKGLTTQGLIYRKLADGKEDKIDFLKPFNQGKLIFIGFNALSKAESILFKKWQEEGIAWFYFDIDNYYLGDDLQEAGRFLRKNLNDTGLINTLGLPDNKIRNQEKKIQVFRVEGQTAQAKLIPQILSPSISFLKEVNNISKVAIILADESLLIPLLQSISTHFPEENKILPLNISMGYSLSNSSLFALLDAWLNLQESISIKNIEVLNSLEIQNFFTNALIPISTITKKEWQNRILNQNLSEVSINQLPVNILGVRLYFKKSIHGLDLLENILELLGWLLTDENSTLITLEEELALATHQELTNLLDGLLEFKKEVSLKLILSLTRRVLKLISIPLKGEPLEGLQILGLMETRSLDFEEIILLGASEEYLPSATKKDSLIPDSIRRAYGLSVKEDQDALSAYIFYRLFQRGKRISLIYNANIEENNSGEPTRYIRQIEFESGFQFSNFTFTPRFTSQKPSPIEIPKSDLILEKLISLYGSGKESVSSVSATAINTYINCPLQFFYGYVANIKEPKKIKADLDAGLIGDIFHLSLKIFYQELKEENVLITSLRILEKGKKIEEIILRAYFATFQKENSQPLTVTGKDKIVLAVIKDYVQTILSYDELNAPFILHYLEDKENFNLLIPIKQGEKVLKVKLKAIIDRIDQKNNKFRIVDYKTGKDSLFFKDIISAFDINVKLEKRNKAIVQSLFYMLIVEKVLPTTYIEPHLFLVREIRKKMGAYFEKNEKENSAFVQNTLYTTKEIDFDATTKNIKDKKPKKQSVFLEGELLKSVKQEFAGKLNHILEEIFNPEVPFRQTILEENCRYCIYKTMCGK